MAWLQLDNSMKKEIAIVGILMGALLMSGHVDADSQSDWDRAKRSNALADNVVHYGVRCYIDVGIYGLKGINEPDCKAYVTAAKRHQGELTWIRGIAKHGDDSPEFLAIRDAINYPLLDRMSEVAVKLDERLQVLIDSR